mgnify:CR=1 FL=1
MRRRHIHTLTIIAALTIAFASIPTFAQPGDPPDETTTVVYQAVQEEPQTQSFQMEVPEIDTNGRTFVGGGGPSFWGAFFDLAALESELSDVAAFDGDLPFADTSVYLLMGGGGFGGRQVRTGGAGAGGSWTSPTSDGSAFDQATLDFGMGGFQIESLIAEDAGFGVSLGALLGRGDWSLTFSRNVSGSFAEVVAQPTTLQMSRSFWLAMPYLSMEYKLLDFVGLKLAGGMGATLSFGNWEVSNGTVAPGGPLKNTLFPVVQVMVVFGD